MKIIDGKEIASQIRKEITEKVIRYTSVGHRPPGLGVILVGDNPASQTYVANKEKAAKECGIKTFDARLSKDVTEKEVREAIYQFNEQKDVDGILMQLPLPKHINSDPLISLINPLKDADGLHPANQGLLMQGRAELKPCTPSGVIELLKRSGVDCKGKKGVVIGRSILVGKPVALMLLDLNVTVTIAHSKTQNLPDLVRDSDIVVAAIGAPEFVKGDWIKKDAVVIDVGINRLESGKLVGDVEYNEASKNASMITPVPGGVGPMTIAMLLQNTFNAYEKNTTL